ncbi:MAG: hypothetical protein LBQ33_05670 [Oscillospiraceae bacterium]|nr:hypothetical protein [Oscillospiraceae bacterium]
MKSAKRILTLGLVMVVFAISMAIPAYAAGEKVYYTLTTDQANPELGSIFTVTLKIQAQNNGNNFHLPSQRLQIFYANNFFEPLGYAGPGADLMKTVEGVPAYQTFNGFAQGTFDLTDTLIADVPWPVSITTEIAQNAGVITLQWLGYDANGFYTMKPVEQEEVLQLKFRVKETAPLTPTESGFIGLYKDYTDSTEFPYYMEYLPDPSQVSSPSDWVNYMPATYNYSASTFPIDVSQANLRIFPNPHPPVLSVKPDAGILVKTLGSESAYDGYIYGFPAEMTQQGTQKKLVDPQIPVDMGGLGANAWGETAGGEVVNPFSDYFNITNGGLLKVSNNVQGKPNHKYEYGTGTELELHDMNKNPGYGRYALVVFGDLDGNFIINLDDYWILQAMLAGKDTIRLPDKTSVNPFENPYHLAADVAAPGAQAALGSDDLQLLYNAALGLPAPSLTQKPTF